MSWDSRRSLRENVETVLRTTAGSIGRVTPRTLANYHRMIDVWEELSPLG